MRETLEMFLTLGILDGEIALDHIVPVSSSWNQKVGVLQHDAVG